MNAWLKQLVCTLRPDRRNSSASVQPRAQQPGCDKRRKSGFTLAEAMMATVVLGFSAAGIVVPYSTGAQLRADGMQRTVAGALATDMIEQIMSIPADEVVATYGSYSESAGNVIKDFATAEKFTGDSYANYSRTASCSYVYVAQQDGNAAPNFIIATVIVSYDGVEVVSAQRLITQ